ncbi:MAG: NigD-like protein [Bacteroidales bacterium]
MKKTTTFFLLILMTPLFLMNSCNDHDGYDLGEYRISIATIKTDGLTNNQYYIELDDNTKLYPTVQNFYYPAVHSQRALVNYTILGDEQGQYDHFVKLNGISNILTKNMIPLTAVNADSIGNDKINIEDIWIGGQHLNIIFNYYVYYPGHLHYINLVQNTTIEYPDNDTTYLEFRHNAKSDQEMYLARGIVSFRLPKDEEQYVFSIKVKTYNQGTLYYSFDYNPIKIAEPHTEPKSLEFEKISIQ